MNSEHRLAQVLLRSWPFPRGAGRILDRYFSNARFKQKTAIVRTTDGFDINVEPNELIGRHIYLTGEFDRSIVEVLCNFSEPGDVLLDVGANIGYVSACFLNNVQNSSVVAVEPQEGILDLLKVNLDRFGRNRIYPFALGDRDEDVWLEVDHTNKGGSQIVEGMGKRTIKVAMRSANRMLSELRIEKLDVVKIDAEGCEERILRDCAASFEKLQPRIILFEELDKSECAEMLRGIGYRVFGMKKSLTALSLHSAEGKTSYHDYVAVSPIRTIPKKAIAAYDGLTRN